MKYFGSNIGVIVNSLLLSVVYILGVGLTSLIIRLSGKRLMDIKNKKTGKTYWNDLNLRKKKIKKYYRQF